MDADPWAVLGLPATASIDEARRAYTRKAQLIHPDKHPDAGAEAIAETQEAMSRLNVAWHAVEGLLAEPGAPGRPDTRRPDVDDAALLLGRNLAAAGAALDLARATTQLRETTTRSLLRRWDRARFLQLNGQLDEMLRHAETRRSHARKLLVDLQERKDRFGTKRRLVRQHRLGVQVHELAVQCHRHLLLAEPVDALISEMETRVTDLEGPPAG